MSNVCDTAGKNTGRSECDPRLGKIEYLFLTISKTFTQEELDDPELLFESIQAAMKLPNGDPNKMYLFPKLRDASDSTGDPPVVSMADGFEEYTDALPKYLLLSTPGNCVWDAMTSFNGWPGKFYYIDNKKQFPVKNLPNGGGEGFQTGNLFTSAPRPGGSGAVNSAATRLATESPDEMKNVYIVKADFNVSSLKNLYDIKLVDREDTNDSGAADNVFKVGLIEPCGKKDQYQKYKNLLNDPLLWVLQLPDGTSVDFDTATTDDATKSFVLTADPTGYGNIPLNSTFYINLASPTVLDEEGVPGIEGIRLRFKKYA